MELEYVKIEYKAPIIYLTFKEGVELGIPEINELNACAKKLSDGNAYCVLCDVRVNMAGVTHEGRRLAAKPAPTHKGTAVIVKNTFYQIAATLFSKFDQPQFPYKVFTDEREAIDWLMQLPLN